MSNSMPYSSGLTAEQFLFQEMRIVSKQYLDGKPIDEIIRFIKQDNLFQYPTERKVSKLARACHRRLISLKNEMLAYEIANAPVDVAKQINLYAMMQYNRIVREFMLEIIGDKFRQHDFSYTRKDINIFFSRLQEQHDEIAAWSENTVKRLKQILTKCLVEIEMLDSVQSTRLNPIMISEELESGIRKNKDMTALAAFNCFR